MLASVEQQYTLGKMPTPRARNLTVSSPRPASSRWRLAGLVPLILGLSACALIFGEEPKPFQLPSPQLVFEPPDPPPPRRRSIAIGQAPIPPRLPELRAPQLAARPMSNAEPELEIRQELEPTAGAASTETIIGLSEREITDLFGQPAQVREEPPATVWRFAAGGCELELYLFMDMATEAFRALSYELIRDGLPAKVEDTCLAQLRSVSGAR